RASTGSSWSISVLCIATTLIERAPPARRIVDSPLENVSSERSLCPSSLVATPEAMLHLASMSAPSRFCEKKRGKTPRIMLTPQQGRTLHSRSGPGSFGASAAGHGPAPAPTDQLRPELATPKSHGRPLTVRHV